MLAWEPWGGLHKLRWLLLRPCHLSKTLRFERKEYFASWCGSKERASGRVPLQPFLPPPT